MPGATSKPILRTWPSLANGRTQGYGAPHRVPHEEFEPNLLLHRTEWLTDRKGAIESPIVLELCSNRRTPSDSSGTMGYNRFPVSWQFVASCAT